MKEKIQGQERSIEESIYVGLIVQEVDPHRPTHALYPLIVLKLLPHIK